MPRSFRPQVEQLEAREMPSVSPIDAGAFASDQILVRWTNDMAATSPLASDLQAIGNNTYDVHLRGGISVSEAVSYYSKLAGVDFAQPDYIVKSAMTPNDTYTGYQWALNAIGLPSAWNYTTGGSRVLVAVIDTGVDSNDTDLAGNVVPGYNFVNNTTNTLDDNGHGTHVSGIIGAKGNNGTGVAGVDWNVEIMPLKFLGSDGQGYLSDAVKAVNFAVAAGAKIINNSWGGGGFDAAMDAAIQNAQNHGVIFVAAAGNDSSNNDTTPEYPASYSHGNVVSVAATDQSNNLASFSDYGQSVTIAAPGVSVLSTTPNNTYTYYSGTSMATPFVTGALALVWSIHPEWSYSQVIADVLNSADRVASLNGKVQTGLLDVGKAVAAAEATLPQTPAPVTPPPVKPVVPTPPASGSTSFMSGSVNLAVAGRQTVASTITIAQHMTIDKLTASVNVQQAQDGAVNITLVSPSGQQILLFNHRGGVGSNLVNTTFDDAATNALWRAAAPFTGSFRPESGLAALHNTDAYGTWKLVVTELDRTQSGTLVNWSLQVNVVSSSSVKSINGGEIASITNASAQSVTKVVGDLPSMQLSTTASAKNDTSEATPARQPRSGPTPIEAVRIAASHIQSNTVSAKRSVDAAGELDDALNALDALFIRL